MVGGVLHYAGDLSVDQKRFDGDYGPVGGIVLRRHLVPNLALRANVLVGRLSSPDLAYPTRNFSFQTDLAELSLQAEWDIFGKSRFLEVDAIFERF